MLQVAQALQTPLAMGAQLALSECILYRPPLSHSLQSASSQHHKKSIYTSHCRLQAPAAMPHLARAPAARRAPCCCCQHHEKPRPVVSRPAAPGAGTTHGAAATAATDAHAPAAGAAAAAVTLASAAAATAADLQPVSDAAAPPAAQSAAAAALADAIASGAYTPGPVELGWEIWVGFVAGVVPFLIASWEFGKRVVSGCRSRQLAGGWHVCLLGVPPGLLQHLTCRTPPRPCSSSSGAAPHAAAAGWSSGGRASSSAR